MKELFWPRNEMRLRYGLAPHTDMFVHYGLIRNQSGYIRVPDRETDSNRNQLLRCDELLRNAVMTLERLDEICCGAIEFMHARIASSKEECGVSVAVTASPEFLAKMGVEFDADTLSREPEGDTRVWIPCGCRRCAENLGTYIKRRW